MRVITKKSEVKEEIDACLEKFHESPRSFVDELNGRLLQAKVKFPLLEYCAIEIHQNTSPQHHIAICDAIARLKTEGGNVIIGIILQRRLDHHFPESIEKAAQYISNADEWYVPDIIGERVYGVALLKSPEKALPELRKLSQHQSTWVVRSVGAGTHYAVKKGLPGNDAEKMFALLLSLATAKDYHIKTGIGWAAKTIAKFHPGIISKYEKELQDNEKVHQWFRSKVDIGLKRNTHAKGN